MKKYLNSYRIIDAHIHLGQFYNQYTSPLELKEYLDSVGVKRFAASSTTICEGHYEKVIDEIRELKNVCGDSLSPILWILPQMLKDGGLGMFMEPKLDLLHLAGIFGNFTRTGIFTSQKTSGSLKLRTE